MGPHVDGASREAQSQEKSTNVRDVKVSDKDGFLS